MYEKVRTPKKAKNEIAGYVSGKEECAEAIISDVREGAYPEKIQK
jgi:ribosomal protein S17E